MGTPAPLVQLARGVVMGAADVVPGVSGGTVALASGIFERLIQNLRAVAGVFSSVVRGQFGDLAARQRSVEWAWLLSLLVGVLLSLVILSASLHRLVEEQPVRTAAVCLGLVAGAAVITGRLLPRADRDTVWLGLIAALSVFVLLGLRSTTTASTGGASERPLWHYLVAGGIAVCAMVLPGVSASLVLVMFGLHGPVSGAISERDVVALTVVALGGVIGIGAFSTWLNWLIARYRELVLVVMIGIMAGSVRVLWPWPGGTASTQVEAPSGDVAVPVVLGLVSFLVVVGVEARVRSRDAGH